MTFSFQSDILSGFEQLRLDLEPDHSLPQPDGQLEATLVRRAYDSAANGSRKERPAVLYLHGFVDYFFHEHLAQAVEEAGFDFYALDLRRSGRSIQQDNIAYFAREVDDFFPEIDWALDLITQEQASVRALIAHSTGGLIASHYAQRGNNASHFEKLILNSPLLTLRANAFEKVLLAVTATLGKYRPLLIAPAKLSTIYGESLHSAHDGEWNYELAWKPLEGVPVRMGWLAMVQSASRTLKKGLNIKKPILTLASTHWHRSGEELQPEDHLADLILSSDDMRQLAPRLGPNSRTRSIPGAKHDVYLSRKSAREVAITATIDFLKH